MRRKKNAIFILSLVINILCACGTDQKQTEQADHLRTTQEADEIAVNPADEPMEEEETGQQTSEESEGEEEQTEKELASRELRLAASAYLETVEELYSSQSADQFALIHVDGDDIPELAAVGSGGEQGDCSYLYTYYEEKSALLMEEPNMGTEYCYIAFCEGKNIVVHTGTVTGERYVYHNIRDGELEQIGSMNRYCVWWDADEEGEEKFFVDDAEVTEEEYEKKQKEIEDTYGDITYIGFGGIGADPVMGDERKLYMTHSEIVRELTSLAEGQGADETEDQSADPVNYREITDKMLEMWSQSYPPNNKAMTEMLRCVTLSKILKEGDAVFGELTGRRLALLNTSFILEAESLTKDIGIRMGTDSFYASKDAVQSYFADAYGNERIETQDTTGWGLTVRGDEVHFMYGDGEPWELADKFMVRKYGNYYLMSGAVFYGDNSGVENVFVGCVDLLFEKNEQSRFGVTMRYGRYRNGEIEAASVEASSELPGQQGKTYSPQNLIDHDYKTVWSEGVEDVGNNETITIHLKEKTLVSGITLCNGYTESVDLFNKNGRVATVCVDFNDNCQRSEEMTGWEREEYQKDNFYEYHMERVELDKPVLTDKIVITIEEAVSGDVYSDTCISEIQVY